MRIICGEELSGLVHSTGTEHGRLYDSLRKTIRSHADISEPLGGYRSRFGNPVLEGMVNQWHMITESLGDNVSGKRVLDLGCGSSAESVEYRYDNGRYQPWFANCVSRMQDQIGLEITGVDISPPNGETFPYLQVDLTKEGDLLAALGNQSRFDLVSAFELFNSPELEKRYSGKDKFEDASLDSAKRLWATLRSQLEHILGDEGIFLWWPSYPEEFSCY